MTALPRAFRPLRALTRKAHPVRMSEFDRLMADEFGASYASLLKEDLHLQGVGGRTAAQALRDGEDPKRVWLAVCEQQSVPEERRFGRDIPPKR